MKRLYDFTIYLGGPIQGCTDEEADNWRDVLIAERGAREMMDSDLAEVRFLNPRRRGLDGLVRANRNPIVVLDKRDIDRSDVLLMNFPMRREMVGASMEIMYAFEHGTPIVVVYPGRGVAPPHPWVEYHATKVVRTTADAMDWIEGMFDL